MSPARKAHLSRAASTPQTDADIAHSIVAAHEASQRLLEEKMGKRGVRKRAKMTKGRDRVDPLLADTEDVHRGSETGVPNVLTRTEKTKMARKRRVTRRRQSNVALEDLDPAVPVNPDRRVKRIQKVEKDRVQERKATSVLPHPEDVDSDHVDLVHNAVKMGKASMSRLEAKRVNHERTGNALAADSDLDAHGVLGVQRVRGNKKANQRLLKMAPTPLPTKKQPLRSSGSHLIASRSLPISDLFPKLRHLIF